MAYVYSIHIKRIHAGQKLKYIPNAWLTLALSETKLGSCIVTQEPTQFLSGQAE